MKDPRHSTDSLFYLIYVTSDGFTLLPVFRNGLHEALQLCCCLTHFLRSGIEGTPETDEQVESKTPATPDAGASQLGADLMFSGLKRCVLILGRVRITWVRSDISATLFMNLT